MAQSANTTELPIPSTSTGNGAVEGEREADPLESFRARRKKVMQNKKKNLKELAAMVPEYKNFDTVLF